MSSDEKALKKGNVEVEKLTDKLRTGRYPNGFVVRTKAEAIFLTSEDLKDLHSLLSELLDTHTVKEECQHKKYTISVSTRNGTRKICNNCGKDFPKEEPKLEYKFEIKNPSLIPRGKCLMECCNTPKEESTTPEKKCEDCSAEKSLHFGGTYEHEFVETPEKKPRLHCFDCNTVHEIRDCTKDRLPSERITEIEKELMAKQPNPMEEVENYAIYCANMKARATVQYLDEVSGHATSEKKCCGQCLWEYSSGDTKCIKNDCSCHQEPQYKIACNDCGSGKQLYYWGADEVWHTLAVLKPYDGITKETRSHEKKCPSCKSINVEATKI